MDVAAHRRLGDESRGPLDYVEFLVTIVGLILLVALRIRQCREDDDRPTPEENREREHRQRILMRRARLQSLGINPYYDSGGYDVDNGSDDVPRLSAVEGEEKRKEWKAFLEKKSLSSVRTMEARMELFASEKRNYILMMIQRPWNRMILWTKRGPRKTSSRTLQRRSVDASGGGVNLLASMFSMFPHRVVSFAWIPTTKAMKSSGPTIPISVPTAYISNVPWIILCI